MLFLKERRARLMRAALCGAVFLVSYLLYRLPLAALGYPALLTALFGLFFFFFDFARYRKAHRALSALRTPEAARFGPLPPAETLGEADLHTVIETLRQAMKELASKSDARYRDTVEYFTAWAHQVKTPIAAMRLALESEDSPKARRLSAEVSRIERYVEMVMAYLRLDAPIGDYVFAPCALLPLVRRVAARFAPEFIDRRLSLTIVPFDRTVVTDEKWLAFILDQLFSNALKYTRTGGVTVSSPGENQLSVKDTGIGIAPEDLPRIFEKGYTGANGRLDRRATGLGLYLSRRAGEKLGVTLKARSAPGEGAELLLTFRQDVGRKE